jgi:hypothetical protein
MLRRTPEKTKAKSRLRDVKNCFAYPMPPNYSDSTLFEKLNAV